MDGHTGMSLAMHNWEYTGVSTLFKCSKCIWYRLEIQSLPDGFTKKEIIKNMRKDEAYIYSQVLYFEQFYMDGIIPDPETVYKLMGDRLHILSYHHSYCAP